MVPLPSLLHPKHGCFHRYKRSRSAFHIGVFCIVSLSIFSLSFISTTVGFSIEQQPYPSGLAYEPDPSESAEPVLSAGSSPRRLASVSGVLINLFTQSLISPEVRTMLKQQGTVLKDLLKGYNTLEVQLPAYSKVPECIISVDFTYLFYVARVNLSTFNAYYNRDMNALTITFKETPTERLQVLREALVHLQNIQLPYECQVPENDEQVKYKAYCMGPRGSCMLTRVDIQLVKIERRDSIQVPFVPFLQFVKHMMEDQALLYSDAFDILEAQTPKERLLFQYDKCILHTVVETNQPSLIRVLWHHADHSLCVAAPKSNNTWFRKWIIIAWGCGVSKLEDITATIYPLSAGLYKVIVETDIMRVDNRNLENGRIQKIPQDLIERPVKPFDMEAKIPLPEYYPGKSVIPYDKMVYRTNL